uniref:RNA-directed DNA polymerase n=1 Tax=Tanacetum cinerariifolium TaxID=118510 RepID=A0A6L2LS08_TANCI|nr:hypothetical protein [Tanacetum cinerariifolium]
MVRALLLDKKNQSSAPAQSSTLAPVKAVEPNCVTCGGTHSYQNCPATNGNIYRDNIQQYMSQAAAANYNQGNTGFRPQMVANKIRPPDFPPHQNHQNNFNRENNFNQNRALAYQAPIPQTQSVSQTDFESYIKANDAVLRNTQSQGQNVQNQYQGLQTQISNLTDLRSKFTSSNTASSSGSGTLPSNTITNPKEDLKGITTESGVAYQGPTIPTQPKVVKQETKVTKDQAVVAPVSVSMPNLKPSILYPSRRDNERRHDQANEQIEKFDEIFKDMSFEISFTDSLIPIPKFASTLKALIGNKEKLSEMARTSMNEHCSVVILNKLLRKLGDPDKFLIPCEFPRMDECLALADLGASINLMPLFVWEGLSLLELTPTYMTLELVDRSISKPIGIAKDVSVKVGVFHLPADFVVVDFEPDPRVPLILEWCFLKTDRALIDVYKGELTLQYSQEVLGFLDVTASGNPTPYDDLIFSTTSPTLTPFGDSDFLLFDEADTFLVNHCLPSPIMNNICLRSRKNSKFMKPNLFNPSLMNLLRLNLRTYLLISSMHFWRATISCLLLLPKSWEMRKKSALIKGLKSHKRAIAWKLSDIQGIHPKFYTHKILMEEDYKPVVQHQRRVNPKIHDVIKKEVEKLLDAGLIYSISDSPWVSLVHCVPKKVGNEYYCFLDGFSGYFQIPIDPRDQEKTTFTCPCRTFAYRHMPFSLCNAPGTFQRCMLAIFHDMVEKTMEVFMDDFSVFRNSFENCLSGLDKMLQRCEDTSLSLNWEKSHFMVKEGIVLGHKISKNGIKVGRAKDLPFELMCDASDFAIGAVLGQRHEKHFRPIHYASKMMNDAESNYTTTEKEMLAVVYAFEKFRSYLIMKKIIVHMDHSALKYLFAKKDAKARLLRWVLLLQEFDFKVFDTKGAENLAANNLSQLENPYENVLDPKGINETFPLETLSMLTFRYDSSAPWFADFANYHAGNFIVKGIDFMGPFPSSRENKYILVAVDYLSKWVEAKALLTNDARVFCKLLKSLFARFGSPRAIISDRGENHASWSDKLDDALWAFCIAYKTPIGCTPYKLVYGKACHLPIELEHKAYWALKQVNFDLTISGDHRKVQLNELNELRDHAYENSLIYKEKTKRIHDSKIKNRVFNVGDRVLLFNSRLKIFSGKLKTHWSGPFTIAKVFPYGTVELSQANGPNFKVNGHSVKHYFGGDVPQLVVPDLQTFPTDQ